MPPSASPSLIGVRGRPRRRVLLSELGLGLLLGVAGGWVAGLVRVRRP